MKEIGSEFWLDRVNVKESKTTIDISSILDGILNIGNDQRLLFSGRTAIDYVLQDISKPIEKVYMPSYCCESMLQPFIDRDIKIDFYNVIVDDSGIKYLIDYKKDFDIFFATSYFGYSSSVMDSIIDILRERDVIIIEDITHRLLSKPNHCFKADYLIASLRKWFPLPSGGLAVKMNGHFMKDNITSPPAKLINKKINAMKQKAEYMAYEGYESEFTRELKKSFLAAFSEFNSGIKQSYKNFSIDCVSVNLLAKIDVVDVKKKRCENAQYLHERLKELKNIKLLFEEVDFKRDCPLFVPIMIESNIREQLKNYLISNNVFCPVHWPIPRGQQLTTHTARLYKQELSLICDQRYGLADMRRITEVVEEFTRNHDRYIF